VITIIDDDAGEIRVQEGGTEQRYLLSSPEGFAAAARAWLRATWDAKYVYSFTWLGRPIIQLPDDLVRVQEVIYAVKPDLLIESGVAHGGGLVFYASLLKLIGRGRVVGIDIDLRPHNRRAIEAHDLAPLITLVHGSSTAPETVRQIAGLVEKSETVMVVLDSLHTYDHVTAELGALAPFVSVGSYVVVCDGIMEQIAGAPRTAPDWVTNNPRRAATDFVATHPEFVIEEPPWPFNEGPVDRRVTYWPDAFIRRIGPSPA
jgi:cephalosporin hydroxylase